MSMTITGLNKFTARLRSASQKLESGGDEVVTDAAEYGAALMREYIATRGVSGNKEGRIDTGHMYDLVTVGPIRHNPSGVAINFGWVYETEDYFAYQEEGFQNVPPMHALLDATVRTRVYFYDEIKKLVKSL